MREMHLIRKNNKFRSPGKWKEIITDRPTDKLTYIPCHREVTLLIRIYKNDAILGNGFVRHFYITYKYLERGRLAKMLRFARTQYMMNRILI